MKVIISAGGTGGHIYPALAIINKIKEIEPNSQFLYIGTHNRMEKDIVPKLGIPFKSIEIYGFNRRNLFKNFKVLSSMLKSRKKCRKIITKFKPDVVIGVGGYVTYPVILEAKKANYKTFIHEQNSIPGKANLFLTKYTDIIGVSFKSSIKYFPEYKTVFTGNPCSENALKVEPVNKTDFDLNENKKLVLIVMGSLGSSKMNAFLTKTMPLFSGKDYEILFVTGKDTYKEISKNKFPDNVKVVPYIDNMTKIMKKTDIIVSRAGASTISEIIALRLPSILIPSPNVTNNHQYRNAETLIENNACVLIEEKNLESELLVQKIDDLLNKPNKIKKMKSNLDKLSMDNSATIIYETLRELIDRK
ncbi:MAG: undecaprenyldiphospho-muramoylpentapeptide beta-N-acetylglucosaminyltransferase [Bacilli bacterium]|nr:undecaprenyldiphospho-muramoylpentapeptide beta-N-acetylglucosaminyltransferase [Bacilli bacterium]